MSTVLLTLAIAFIVVAIAIGLLSVGWLITGKAKLRAGACGRDPNKLREEEGCGTDVSCSLCEKPKDDKKV